MVESKASIWHRLYHGETSFDFVGRMWRWFVLSALVIAVGVVSLLTRGLNLGIDFRGGTAWEVKAPEVSVGEARDALRPLGLADAKIQILGGDTLRVQADVAGRGSTPQERRADKASRQQDVKEALAELADVRARDVSINDVGPSWGKDVTRKAQRALFFFFVAISLYITLRFEWKMAFAALAAVVHDILVTVGVYSLSGFEVTPATVVAFLTILGYSLYDTIVVFDKVEENTRGLAASGRMTYADTVNLSMNQVLMRSLNTSLVAILPILSVLLVGALVLGATTLQDFGLALLIGLLTGAYSSIYIASPVLAWLKEREPRYASIRQRLLARGATGGPPLTPAAAAATPSLAPTPVTGDGERDLPTVASGLSRGPSPGRPPGPSSVRPAAGRPAPRPRKKKRR